MMEEIFSEYFDRDSSMEASGASLRETLSIISRRYIGQNPEGAYRFRAFRTDSFLPEGQGVYDLDLNKKLPEAKDGQYSVIAAKFNKPQAELHTILINSYSKLDVYFNSKLLWQSSPREENLSDMVTAIDLPCEKGWNTLLLKCRKTASGFGCSLGPQMPNWRWLSFLAPFENRYGQGGFVYSRAFDAGEYAPEAIDLSDFESATKMQWYPDMSKGRISNYGALEEVFGNQAGKWACAWTRLAQNFPCKREINLVFSGADFYLDGKKLAQGLISLTGGEYDLLAISRCPELGSWTFSFSAQSEDGAGLEFLPPGNVSGIEGNFLYAGPFKSEPKANVATLYGLLGEADEYCYWRSTENTVIRPYLENECFGRWNYPLGVTLYGLTQTSRVLGATDIDSYVGRHFRECADLHDYCLWDAKTYGYPEMNNQITALKSLDDCGSFGSAMLEFYKDKMNPHTRALASRIAEHISCKQERREDGALYRKSEGNPTMWVDDLYMSIPFLCRYARLSGDDRYIDDAVRQVFLFKKYLFIPEYGVMSHIYDFNRATGTKIPWGRGNGWCLFSISELLEFLPEDHSDRHAILEFFSRLCEGYLKLQGSRGLWHQVLTCPDTYEESSCTAMFTYAFCRAVRFHWVDDNLADRLFVAARKAWKGLRSISIDRFGNIYGVCRGSYYSFTTDYYRDTLGWTLNDTHGTGIIMLAGIEMEKVLKNNE